MTRVTYPPVPSRLSPPSPTFRANPLVPFPPGLWGRRRGVDVGMQDRQVGLWYVLAAALWMVAAALILGGATIGLVAGGGLSEKVAVNLMVMGLGSTGAALALSIKHMLSRYHRLLREAFEMGRAHERSSSSVHSIR